MRQTTFRFFVSFCLALCGFLYTVPGAAAQTYAYVVGQRDDPPGGPNSGIQHLNVVDTSTNTIVKTIALGLSCVCINPDSIAISPDGTLVYVTNELDDTVSVIDTASNTVVSTINLGAGAAPTAVVVSPSGQRLYVVKGSGNTGVAVINTSNNALLATVPLGVTQARGMAVTPDGARLYVSTFSSNSIKVINTATNAVSATIPVGAQPVGVDVTPDGTRVYVALYLGAAAAVIDTSSNTVITNVAVGEGPQSVRVNPAGTHVYVPAIGSHMLSVIQVSSNTVVDATTVNYNPITLDFDPQNPRAYIAANLNVHTIDTATNDVVNSLPFSASTHGYPGAIAIKPAAVTTDPLMSLDTPTNGSAMPQPFQVGGWALDRGAPTGTGVDMVHVYAYPNPGSGQAAVFLGAAGYGSARGDVGAAFGTRFTNSGFSLTVDFLPAGSYLIAVYARSTVSGANQVRTAVITIQGGPLIAIDAPTAGQTLAQPFSLSGWAIDTAAPSGSGIDTLHVWAYPNPGSGAEPIFVGEAAYGHSRPDVGAAYGSRFTNSGYSISVRGLAPGPHEIVVFAHSTATGTFNRWVSRVVTIDNDPKMSLDMPSAGTVSSSFVVAGWAIDYAARSGTGVDAIHVWAYPNPGSGTPAQFVGVATYGRSRPDVGAAFGSQFSSSGYDLTVTSLAPGTYDLVVFARSVVSNEFDNWRVVRVTVP